MAEAIIFSECDGVGRLVLNRPERGNAVSPDFIAAFTRALDEVEASRDLCVLIISGQGKHFCAGADVQHLAQAPAGLETEIGEMAAGFHAALLRLWMLQVPVITAVQGSAVGAGMGLALTGDFVICSDNARFATGYARLGLSPDAGVSFFLSRLLGPKRAARLLMSGAVLGAEEALTLGLADRVCSPDQLAEAADAAAADYVKFAPLAALAAVKRLTRAAASASLSNHLDHERSEIMILAASVEAKAALERLTRKP